MNKCKLLLALSIVLMMPFFALKNVEASTNVTQYANGLFDYGSWTTYYVVNSNGYVITDMFDTINVPAQWESALITKVVMKNYYSGQITLQLRGNINTNLWEYYVEGDGVYSLRTTDNNKISIYLNNSNEFYIYAFCGNDNDTNFVPYAFSYPTGSLDVSPSIPEFYNSFNEYQLIDHYFPAWNLTAYLWGKSYSEYTNLYGLDIPFCSILTSGNINAFNVNHRIPIFKDQTMVMYLLTDKYIQNSSISAYSYRGANVTFLNKQHEFPRIKVGNINQVLYLNEISFSTDYTGGSDQVSFEFSVNNINCYPVFIGDYYNVPKELSLLASDEYRDTYTKLLQQIIDSLAGNPNITPVNPDVYSDTSTAITDTNTVETSIQGDFNNAMNNINLNDYGIGSTLYQSMVFLTDNLQQIFNKSGEFKILFTLPLVLGIALFFIGRGSVVFRQGNIDRAEFRNDMKNYHANEEADRIMGYESDSRATNVAAGRVSHSRIIKRK